MTRAIPTRDRVRLRERLFRFPEVILPFAWPRWSGGAEAKVHFWEAFGPWRAGTLTDPATESPYHDGPCIERHVWPHRPQIGRGLRDIRFFRPRRTVGMNIAEDPLFAGVRSTDTVARPHREFDPEKDQPSEAVAKADEHREHTTPQFFLRNVGRVERLDDEIIPWELRESELQGFDDRALEEARRIQRTYTPPPLNDRPSYHEMGDAVDEMRDLMYRIRWTRFFGHDVKQRVPGPLWKHFPDEAMFRRYAGPDAQRVEARSEDQDTS